MSTKTLTDIIEASIKGRAEYKARIESDAFEQDLAALLEKHGVRASVHTALIQGSTTQSFVEARSEIIAGQMRSDALRRILGDDK